MFASDPKKCFHCQSWLASTRYKLINVLVKHYEILNYKLKNQGTVPVGGIPGTSSWHSIQCVQAPRLGITAQVSETYYTKVIFCVILLYFEFDRTDSRDNKTKETSNDDAPVKLFAGPWHRIVFTVL